MRIADALAETERALEAAGVPTPRVDAEWLVAHTARRARSELTLGGDVEAAPLRRLVERRVRREPLAYVLGEWGFRRLTLKTDARALVPRPETEVVVERALALIAPLAAPRVLDVGVGGGAIALAIADEHRGARVTGVDVSPAALALARENAERLGLPIELRGAGVEAVAEGWDLVVANPPYVPERELRQLEPELAWEPQLALVATGLCEEIVARSRTRFLVLEVADGDAARVAALLADAGFGEVTITADLGGRERIVEGTR